MLGTTTKGPSPSSSRPCGTTSATKWTTTSSPVATACLLATAVIICFAGIGVVNGQEVIVTAAPGGAPTGDFCNICGTSNTIGNGTAVAEFLDHEKLSRAVPCDELQRLINIPNIFPTDFCPDLVAQVVEPCQCKTPDGDLVAEVQPVTPTPGFSFTIAPTTSLFCNICGPGGTIGPEMQGVNAEEVLIFNHEEEERQWTCDELQRNANTPSVLPPGYCSRVQDQVISKCKCRGPDGNLVGPTPSPASAPEPTPPTSWAPTVACNICGEGNQIGSPDSTVKFIAIEGNQRELGCQQVQDLINQGSAPPGWCELVAAAAPAQCGCLTSDGAPVDDPNAVDPDFCNICGPTNIIGEGGAVVFLEDHEGLIRRFPCQELQTLANTPFIFPEGFCSRIIEQTLITCRCTTPDGILISDLLEPTGAPIPEVILPVGPPADGPDAPSAFQTPPPVTPAPVSGFRPTDDSVTDNGTTDSSSATQSTGNGKKNVPIVVATVVAVMAAAAVAQA